MNNDNLKSLLANYERKRNSKIADANLKKEKIIYSIPELEKVENDINSLSIKAIKLILTTRDKSLIDNLNKQIACLKSQKLDILKKHNLSQDDFLPKFDCTICKDTGFVKQNNNNVLCNCIKQKLYNIEYNHSNIYDLQNQNFDNFRLSFYSDLVDEYKYGKNISPRDNIISIKKICQHFIDHFDDPDESNLLFCGSPGLGKTFLSSCIANEMIKRGKTVLYQTAPMMLDNIIDYKFGKSSNNIISSINSVDLLIIDDLGTESKNNLKITELFNIINTRLLNQNNKITKTIISTNLSLQDLYNTYEERIVSRIIGNYNACYFFGDDIRIKKKLKV